MGEFEISNRTIDSMLRIKDPKASCKLHLHLNSQPLVPSCLIESRLNPCKVKFYEHLGMKQIHKMDFPDNQFSLYFLAYDPHESTGSGAHFSSRQGILELTHNHGSENDPNFKVANGNSEPGKGFGHICVSVDNIQAACQRLEDASYKFQKKLSDGRMRHIAFALDPDG